MGRIRIGQVGICHEHAAAKTAALLRLPEVFEIVGVVDDRQTSCVRYRGGQDLTPYEGLRWMTEQDLLALPDLQAIIIETPNGDLVPTALRCLERGLPMHMDKPGGEDLPLFRKLLSGCQSRGVPLQMGYMFRHNPALQWCIQAIGEGWLGDIFEIHANMSHDYGGPEYQTYLGGYRGGIMFNLGCHLIDWVVALLGRPVGVTPFLMSTPGLPAAVVNNAQVVLTYPHTLVTLRACSMEVQGLGRRGLKVCGTNGTIELCPLERFDGQPLQLRLTLRDSRGSYAPGVHVIDLGIIENRYEDELKLLARVVRGEVPAPWSVDHDELVQEVVLAASGYLRWEA